MGPLNFLIRKVDSDSRNSGEHHPRATHTRFPESSGSSDYRPTILRYLSALAWYLPLSRPYRAEAPSPSMVKDAVTVACTSALRMVSVWFKAPFLPTMLASRAPANESPSPVGSTRSSVGKAGRVIVPQGR